ncbi:MAG: DUF4438 domain-containing protein, partial [Deltaproteobacteria bacterium]
MLETNREDLIIQSVIGEIVSPTQKEEAYKVGFDGVARVLPGTGGITYNARIGDSAIRWVADHVEPGVSIRNLSGKSNRAPENMALNILSCIGNEARVVSGDARGAKGRVTGTHGGIHNVMVDFEPEVLEQLTIGDRIQIKAYGTGLRLLDFPEITVMNLDPGLLEVIDPQVEGDSLVFPVTHLVPAQIMGSGLGNVHTYAGDYDIQLFDERITREFGLDTLRFGDFVAITDAAHEFGRIYLDGAISIGVVVHSACILSGHGPGVTTVATSRSGKIRPEISREA